MIQAERARDGIAELPSLQMCCFVSTCVDVEDFKLDAAAAQPQKLVRPNVLPKLLIEVSLSIQYISMSLKTGNRLCPVATPTQGSPENCRGYTSIQSVSKEPQEVWSP